MFDVYRNQTDNNYDDNKCNCTDTEIIFARVVLELTVYLLFQSADILENRVTRSFAWRAFSYNCKL